MDKFSAKSAFQTGGSLIDKWIIENLISLPQSKNGPLIASYTIDGTKINIPMNNVGLLFDDCRFMREGTSKNYGDGGSNCVSGNPIRFVELSSVFSI